MVGILVGRKVGWFVGAFVGWLVSCWFVSKAFGGVAGTDHSSVLSPVDSSVDFRAVGVFVGRIATATLTGGRFGGLVGGRVAAFVD